MEKVAKNEVLSNIPSVSATTAIQNNEKIKDWANI